MMVVVIHLEVSLFSPHVFLCLISHACPYLVFDLPSPIFFPGCSLFPYTS